MKSKEKLNSSFKNLKVFQKKKKKKFKNEIF
jgi:hypothetical protein